MTDDDANAVVAYLRSIPAVDHQVQANQSPAADYNNGAPVWDVQPLLDNQIPMPRGGTNNSAAMHGRYLASATGLCIDCHTPEVAPGAIQLDMSKAFAGGKVFPSALLGLLDPSYPPVVATRNLTSDATGLGGWTKDQIKAAIALGKDQQGKAVCAATHGAVISPYAGLTDGDLDDIAEYLLSLAPVVNDTANDPAAANCGVPPIGGTPEDPGDCGNNQDDDGDNVPDDGCPVACGNCAGPTVP
jgi:mono/diheme cytochrome c family protein